MNARAEIIQIGPQAGPQEVFLSSPADIAIYGGAAGGGKTWALLMEPLRHIHNPNFGAVFFRRNTVQIRNEGGLWDESLKLYPALGAEPVQHTLDWKFPSGAKISMRHLEYDKTVLDWQGSQIPLLCFDELTHFSAHQFWYMLSRNRSISGVRPYVRASTNPDPDSWVAKFIEWWIDQSTGLAIPERSGRIRWFVREGETIHWADNPADLARFTMPGPDGEAVPIPPKSVTFIAAKLTDNKALMLANPDYQANLLALSTIERERLLAGNWKVRPMGGMLHSSWWRYYEVPPQITHRVIFADTAQKTKEASDYSVFQCWGYTATKQAVLLDQIRGKWEAPDLMAHARAFWNKHLGETGKGALRAFKVEDKVSGTGLIQTLRREGIPVLGIQRNTDKLTRVMDAAPYIESGNVLLPSKAPWLSDFLAECSAFPNGAHDDQIDPMCDAVAEVHSQSEGGFAVL